MELVGYILGFIAVVFFFIAYQIFDKKKLLITQSIAIALISLQYLLIGAYSGCTLNVVCLIRNILYYYRDKKGRNGLWLPGVISLVLVVVSLFSWEGIHSLLIVAGLVVNTVATGIFDTQNVRKSILVSCSLIFVYNFIEGSYSAMLNEIISIGSALVGIIRYHQKQKQKGNGKNRISN